MLKALKIIAVSLSGLIFILVVILYFLALKHRDYIHQKTIELINEHIGEEVSFSDFSVSFLERFPKLGIDIRDIEIKDSIKTVVKINEINFYVNIPELKNNKIILEKIVINSAEIEFQVDSMGKKPRFFHTKKPGNSSKEKRFDIELGKIHVNNLKLTVGNYYKHNHTYVNIDKALLQPIISENEFLISGNMEGRIDSLVGSDKTIIREQPVLLKDALLRIDRKTKEIQSEKGEIFAHSLKLIPKLHIHPGDSLNSINFRIDSEGTINDFLEIVNLQFETKLMQENPDALMKIAFRQNGFINQFLKPNTFVDFELANALIKEEDLPYPIDLAWLRGTYTNGDKQSAESTQIRIDTLSAKIEDSFIYGKISVSNLLDPFISTHIDANINLDHLVKETPKMKLNGSVMVDAKYSGKVSELKKMHYSDYLSQATFQNIIIELKSQNHIIKIPSAAATLKNHLLEVPEFKGTIDDSEFNISAHIQNPLLHIVNKNEYLNAALWINCDKISMNTDNESGKTDKTRGFAEGLSTGILNHIITDIRVKCKNLSIPNHEFKNIDLTAKQRSDSISFKLANLGIGEGTITGKGNFIYGKKGFTNVNADIKGHLIHYDFTLNKEQNESGKKRSIIFPPGTHLNLELLIDNAKLGSFEANKFDVDFLVTNRKIDIRKMCLEIQEGKVNAKGNLDIDTSGFSGGNFQIGMDFKRLDANEIIAKLPKNEKPSANKNNPGILKNLTAKINFTTKEFLYSDLLLTDLNTSCNIGANQIKVDKFKCNSSFGSADLNLTVNDYLSKDREIKSNIIISLDSLDLEKILAMKLFQNNKKTEQPEKKEFLPFDMVFNNNVEMKLNLAADQIQYKKKQVNNLDLQLDLNGRIIDMKNLDFMFASGSTHLQGYILNNEAKNYPCFVTSDIKNLDIQQVLNTFDNFNQTVITPENTSGLFSWKSTHYLSFDPNLKININDNYWDFNFLIHDAELKDVEPLQNALFFIGHKEKSNMVIKDLNVSVSMFKDKIYFTEIIMNDNIANLEIIGSYSLADSVMDVGSRISLTDLFFKTKKERIVETMEGKIPLEQDSKVFLQVKGNLAKHKINLLTRRKMERFEKELKREIEIANKMFEQKEAERKDAS